MLKTLIPTLAGQRVLVLGDVILDEYLTGTASRLSREAPIPVLEFESRRLIPGGAANPAANITALGSTAMQVGVIGADTEATALRQVLQARGIDTLGLLTDSSRPTTVKTRIMAQMGLRFPQQVARLDRLSRTPVSPAIEERLCALAADHIGSMTAVLLSDYHAGLLTPSLVNRMRELGESHMLLLTADAQGELDKYGGFGVVKCNADEARAYLRRTLDTADDFDAAALDLCRALRLTWGMVITRGADGATLATPDGQTARCPAPAVTDVFDTVGAGDTTIAVLTLAAAAGAAPYSAVTLANYASGLVVRRVGNYAPTPDELAWAVEMWGDRT